MTIVFPRPMPAAGAARQVFELKRVDYLSPEAGGRLGAMAGGVPLWYAKWTLGQGGQQRSEEWQAFVDSLDGPARLFIGEDLSRPYPLAYPNGFAGMVRAGGGAFDGSAAAWSRHLGDDGQALVALNGLPAGFKIARRDYLGFRWETGGVARRAMVRFVESVTVNEAGWIPQTAIRPAIPMAVPSNAVAHFDRPGCLMRLIPSETQMGEMDRRLAAAVTVAALQDILP
jgi:hypothetical protein